MAKASCRHNSKLLEGTQMATLESPIDILEQIDAANAERLADDVGIYFTLVRSVADSESIPPDDVLEELRGLGKSLEEFRTDIDDLARLRKLRESAAHSPRLETKLRTELNPAVAAARVSLKNEILKLEDELRQAKANQSQAVRKAQRCRQDGIEAVKVEQGLKARIGLPDGFAF